MPLPSTAVTIGENDGWIQSEVNGTPQTVFNVDFPFFSLDDVVVEKWTDATGSYRLYRGVDYTLGGTPGTDGVYPSGTVTLNVAVSNALITRYRMTDLTRLSNFPLTGHFDRQSLNSDLNREVAAAQDQRRLAQSAIRFGEVDYDQIKDLTLPLYAGAPGKIIAFDLDGKLVFTDPLDLLISSIGGPFLPLTGGTITPPPAPFAGAATNGLIINQPNATGVVSVGAPWMILPANSLNGIFATTNIDAGAGTFSIFAVQQTVNGTNTRADNANFNIQAQVFVEGIGPSQMQSYAGVMGSGSLKTQSLMPSVGATITIASPGVVTHNSHGLGVSQLVQFSTTGTLPTGIVAGTPYYVQSATANTFTLCTFPGGPAINTSGSQSGTHSYQAQLSGNSLTGVNANVSIDANMRGWAQLTGFESDMTALAGATLQSRVGYTTIFGDFDATRGSFVDASFYWAAQYASAVGWRNIWLLDNSLGKIVDTDSVLMSTRGGATVQGGIDLSGWAFLGSPFKSPGFSVDGAGVVTSPAFKSTGIQAILIGLAPSSTSQIYAVFQNLGNVGVTGLESSVGGSIFSGSNPYGMVIGEQSGAGLQIATGGIVRADFANTLATYKTPQQVLWPSYSINASLGTVRSHLGAWDPNYELGGSSGSWSNWAIVGANFIPNGTFTGIDTWPSGGVAGYGITDNLHVSAPGLYGLGGIGPNGGGAVVAGSNIVAINTTGQSGLANSGRDFGVLYGSEADVCVQTKAGGAAPHGSYVAGFAAILNAAIQPVVNAVAGVLVSTVNLPWGYGLLTIAGAAVVAVSAGSQATAGPSNSQYYEWVALNSSSVGYFARSWLDPVAGWVVQNMTGTGKITLNATSLLDADTWTFRNAAGSQTYLTLAPTSASFLKKVNTIAPGAASGAGLNLAPGTTPTTPANGDLWTTSLGLYAQIAGATVGPYAAGSGFLPVNNPVFTGSMGGPYYNATNAGTGYQLNGINMLYDNGTFAVISSHNALNEALLLTSAVSVFSSNEIILRNAATSTQFADFKASGIALGQTTTVAGSVSSTAGFQLNAVSVMLPVSTFNLLCAIDGSNRLFLNNSGGVSLFRCDGGWDFQNEAGSLNLFVIDGAKAAFGVRATFDQVLSFASATALAWDDVRVSAATTTITGNTGSPITRLAKVGLYRPTLTDSSVVVVTEASTLWIENAPLQAGSLTITNAWALCVAAGATRLQAVTVNSIQSSGAILSSGSALGYSTGAGGTVTQSPNKSSTVSLSKACGIITLANAALAANTGVNFTFTNTLIAAGDFIMFTHESGGTIGAYAFNAVAGAGSATVTVRNITAGSLTEAPVVRFAILKSVNA